MSRIVQRLGATLVLAASSLFIGSNVFAEVEITHDPPEEVLAGARTTLQAEITDDEAGVDQVRAYFRTGESSDYVQQYMTDVNYDKIEKLTAWAAERERGLNELAQAWLMAQPLP